MIAICPPQLLYSSASAPEIRLEVGNLLKIGRGYLLDHQSQLPLLPIRHITLWPWLLTYWPWTAVTWSNSVLKLNEIEQSAVELCRSIFIQLWRRVPSCIWAEADFNNFAPACTISIQWCQFGNQLGLLVNSKIPPLELGQGEQRNNNCDQFVYFD